MVKNQLIDNWGRPINYLRLAVTDRCNLRCFYCMPEEGIKYLPKEALLTYEELERLVTIFCELGINKLRITGGEPLVRRDVIPFMHKLSKIDGLHSINMTTNGLLTSKYMDKLKDIGIKSINLSLDTLDSERFKKITRRDEFENVYNTLMELIDTKIDTKINMVVMGEQNIEDIIPMARLTLAHDISIRFIEEMPFNGSNSSNPSLEWTSTKILSLLKDNFDLTKIEDPKNSTADHYKIASSKGNLGIISAYTRTFCGSCNRIRLTAQGELRTCLYANHGLDLKSLLRNGSSDETIKTAISQTVNNRHKNGFEAEQSRNNAQTWESMSTIGG